MEDEKFPQNIFPIVKNVSPRTLADDIFPYIPGDEENMQHWDEVFMDLKEKIVKAFDEKGIPLPKIKIDYSEKPISRDDHPLLR